MSAAQSSIDIAHDMGAAAYQDGFSRKENPYNKESSPDEFNAWNNGWDHEKNYYDGKL